MTKVGILHYTMPPQEVGGVEAIISHHAKFLSKMGYEVHLIYGNGGGLEYDNLISHRIPLLSSSHPYVQKVQEEVLKESKETPGFIKLKDEIKEELLKCLSKIDVCIVHNIPSMPFNFAATAALNEIVEKIDIKFIFWLHDSALFREEWKNRIGKFPLSLLHYHSPRIIYVTPTSFRAKQFSQLQEPYAITNMKVIPNGVSIEEYIKIDETTKLLMKKLGVSFEDYIILTPVRVTPRKNIELALFVVDELKHLIGLARKIKLLITGPPDHQAMKMGMAYLQYLKEIIKERSLNENVIFCYDVISLERKYKSGSIVKWSVADVYNISDLIFVPSKEEGFGLPIIEAGAVRKPVFCSRIPPFQELIRDGIEGYMFDLNEDPKSIAFKIYRYFLMDVVDNNFNNVINRFSWDTIIKKIVTLF